MQNPQSLLISGHKEWAETTHCDFQEKKKF